MSTFVVIGARGGVGQQLVHRLLARDASLVAKVIAVVRDPSALTTAGTGLRSGVQQAPLLPDDPRLQVVAGDVTAPDKLAPVLKGAAVVFNASSGRSYEQCLAVDERGVGGTADAALRAGVGRYVLCSSQLVDPGPNTWTFVRLLLNNVVTGVKAPWSKSKGLMDMKFEGEQLLRRSGVAYTIVRPGRLVDGPIGTAPPLVGQTNRSFAGGAQSTRADVAEVMVLASLDERARNCTFELAGGKPDAAMPGTAPPATLFACLRPAWDQEQFPQTAQ